MRRGKLDSLGVSAFCESMAMMVQSGIQMDEAVALLRSGGGQSGPLEQGIAVMQEQTEAGKGLAAAMEATGIFLPLSAPAWSTQSGWSRRESLQAGWRMCCSSWPATMRTRRL